MNQLSQSDKTSLLQLSRSVLSRYLNRGELYPREEIHFEITTAMKEKAAGFVTLTKNGELRGCIGEIFATRDILEVVMERTIDAATRDNRFVPVSIGELDDIKIEISVLTWPQKIDSYSDIEIGKHGIILEKNGQMALFLPQVAPEQGWDLETTLTHLSLKAGLKPTDWKEGASFEIFEAIVFGEKE